MQQQTGGSSAMRITIVGMSHVEALRRALPPDQDRITLINLNLKRDLLPFIAGGEWLDAEERIRPRFKAALDRGGHFVSLLGGNAHNVIGLIEHPVRYDFVEPDAAEAAPAPGRQLVPYDAMWALLEARVAPFLRWLGELAPHFAGRRLHVSSPPPIASARHIEQFPGVFAKKIRQGVAPAALRAKLFRLNSTMFQAECAGLGVDFLPPPAAALDADGLLTAGYWGQDPTHGNEAYGRLVLQQIEEHVAS
jgi:hypothetical protein